MQGDHDGRRDGQRGAGDAPSHGLSLVPIDSVRAVVEQSSPAPVHGVRGDAPGPRGCWAVKRDGQPCRAAALIDSDYCAAHSGRGVASDPARWQPIAVKASALERQRRARIRVALGSTRFNTPRGVLKSLVMQDAARVAAAALDGAIDPAVPVSQRAKAALALIDAVDPPSRVEVEVPLPSDPDGVMALGLEELEQVAKRLGIES